MYTPPIQDQKFVLEYLIGFDSIIQQLSLNGQKREEIDKDLIFQGSNSKIVDLLSEVKIQKIQ